MLDFGLAKANDASGHIGDLADSPTIVSPVVTTGVGVILGTAAYEPRASEGNRLKRSDVWAFGCVLYEMLAGKRVFDGGMLAETLAAILRADRTGRHFLQILQIPFTDCCGARCTRIARGASRRHRRCAS